MFLIIKNSKMSQRERDEDLKIKELVEELDHRKVPFTQNFKHMITSIRKEVKTSNNL